MLKTEIIFSDHMVFQRNKNIRVFGEGDNGSRIKVVLKRGNRESVAFATVKDGKFEAVLAKEEATKIDESCELTVSDGKEELRFIDIAIGEVYLAGGQSNMELELQNATGGRKILDKPLSDNDIRKNLRYYYTPKLSYKDDEYEETMRNTCWKHFGKEDAANWSAVGYYFALKLAKKLGVTIGIIGCNWGGTVASCWMSREMLLSKKTTEKLVLDFEASPDFKKTEKEQIEDYKQYVIDMAEWDKKSAEVYAVDPMISWDDIQAKIGKCPYPGPKNCASFQRPAGLYETMVKRVAPYTIGGFIYYQGESDEVNPEMYYDLQTSLIMQWRADFKDDELPFIITQLPMHRYQHDPDTKAWCIIREAQLQAYKDLKNVGVAVIIDCGEFHQIHPPKKKKVGKRLAMQALSMVYGLMDESEAFGPLYKDYLIHDGGIEIFFDFAKDGFKSKKKKNIGFEIAGEDGEFKEASFEIKGDSIFLSNPEIEEPVKARYLWSNYAEVYLFGNNGLPVAPFKTWK